MRRNVLLFLLCLSLPQMSSAEGPFQLPPEPAPVIPAGDEIIVYINGGPGSRLEESADLIPWLHEQGLQRGKRYTVIGFDSPSDGYSSMVDHTEIFPNDNNEFQFPVIPFTTPRARYPLVAFGEQFVVDFVHALDGLVPVANRNVHIIGGSTGGCITLRLGHRVDQPWIKHIAAWNPACVWTTYNHDIFKSVALLSGRKRWREDPPKRGPEREKDRKEYFDRAFGPPTQWYSGGYTQPNPEEWFRGGRGKYSDWRCKWDHIGAARLEQQEVYNPAYRRWHWRYGTELLLFSFFNDGWETGHDAGASHRPAVYNGITIPTLLAAGDDDDWDEGPLRHWENRWTNTNKMARLMRNTPGRTEFLRDTGHSIHNERPRKLAREIVDFITDLPPLTGPLQILPEETPAEDEACRPILPRFPAIPSQLLEQPAAAAHLALPARKGGSFDDGKSAGSYSLRLKPELRAVAAAHDPINALARSAMYFYEGNTLWGKAMADLAVTGRAAYARFRELRPDENLVLGALRYGSRARLREAVLQALKRAYRVAWALRDTDARERERFRAGLGWITVSGEDDPPHRPVNTSNAPYPQYDLSVRSHGRTFQIRYMVASP